MVQRAAAIALTAVGLLWCGPAATGDAGEELLKADSRSPYVHRITLYDHDGTAIGPEDMPAMPYSPRRTCGKCHPYDDIRHGWHFNEADDDPPAGRQGEPWMWVDEDSGITRLISGRGWDGTQRPAELELSPWDMVKLFGRHFPGGSFGEPSDEVVSESEQWLRWGVSGRLEIDCLFCHSTTQQHDQTVQAVQIEAENFKWSPTVADGLAVVRGEARKAPDDWDPYMPPNPDFPEQAGPSLVYDLHRFDPDERVLLPLSRRVPNERCYYCHTTRVLDREDWEQDQDVHLAAGLLCVDCHRHGLDHAMTRGYAGEVHPTTQPTKASLSCAGCHLGTAGTTAIEAALGGRLRAPYPQHRGFPPLHFERMTCTACHVGPWPREQTVRMQTSLAHRLGLATRERNDESGPHIAGPVFGTQFDGRLAVQKTVLTGQTSMPRYRWSIGHNVRPAAQSLGVRGCDDCHAMDAPLFFGKVPAVELALDRRTLAASPMHHFFGYDGTLAQAWALGFVFRPAFKVYALLAAGLIAFVVWRFVSDELRVVMLRMEPVSATTTAAVVRPGLTFGEHLAHGLVVLAVLINASTGLGIGLIGGGMRGWTLLVHMAGAGLFITGLMIVAWQWAGRCRRGGDPQGLQPAQRWVFRWTLFSGLAVMLPMIAAMLPVFGYAAQHVLVEVHEIAAIVLVITLVVHTVVSLAARRTRGQTK